MNWDQLLSIQRLGKPRIEKIVPEGRTQFQRDFDRLIFSSPFRRLQNKTQVFPLPGSVFVHNRLTHSLEVSSVGRSLGTILSEWLIANGNKHPFIPEIGSIVASGCLAHDMGNPPFGHSGEDAIKSFFAEGVGQELKPLLNDEEWCDLIKFDGNANAFRLLTHQFKGRRKGGFVLTYSMLASIVKYPYESVATSKAKFGFFQSDKMRYDEIATRLGILKLNDSPQIYARHPLVYLVEAADDICYQVMDIEDAHKLKILSYEETMELFLSFYNKDSDSSELDYIHSNLKTVSDKNERISVLRAAVIGKLIHDNITIFKNNYLNIMDGTFQGSLMKNLQGTTAKAMQQIQEISVDRIYSDQSVLEIELAGFKIISTLLEAFINGILKKDSYGSKIMKLFPDQFKIEEGSNYEKIQSVIDFVSGMTDVYALDLYRKITGINIPGI